MGKLQECVTGVSLSCEPAFNLHLFRPTVFSADPDKIFSGVIACCTDASSMPSSQR